MVFVCVPKDHATSCECTHRQQLSANAYIGVTSTITLGLSHLLLNYYLKASNCPKL